MYRICLDGPFALNVLRYYVGSAFAYFYLVDWIIIRNMEN